MQHHIAGKQLGHAGVVVLDGEFLQFDVEGQVLQHHAIRERDQRDVLLAALRDKEIAAVGRVAFAEAVACWHIGHLTVADIGGLVLQQHLQSHDQVAVDQAADADQHDRAVRSQIAQTVRGALARRNHRAVGAVLNPGLPAARGQQPGDAVERGGRRLGHFTAAFVMEGL